MAEWNGMPAATNNAIFHLPSGIVHNGRLLPCDYIRSYLFQFTEVRSLHLDVVRFLVM
jgi:hypothetical protein